MSKSSESKKLKVLRSWILLALFSLSIPALILAHGSELLAWVKYDQDSKKMFMSDARTAVPAGAEPGLFYEMKKGRLKEKRQWRSPLDLIVEYRGGTEGRVVFSHERHFALTGEKSCSKCHDDAVGLGEKDKIRESKASSPQEEAHGAKGMGRFCATCHNGKTVVGEISKSAPRDMRDAIFTANRSSRSSNGNSCQKCHAPRNHGIDFTNRHGELAEHGRGDCESCHRGADKYDGSYQNQAKDFRTAQLQLMNNPENEAAFKKILPPNFCMYCHNGDQKAWKGERKSGRGGEGGEGRHSESGHHEDDDD